MSRIQDGGDLGRDRVSRTGAREEVVDALPPGMEVVAGVIEFEQLGLDTDFRGAM